MTDTDDGVFSSVSHSRTADEVVQQIELLILDGVLRDGDRCRESAIWPNRWRCRVPSSGMR